MLKGSTNFEKKMTHLLSIGGQSLLFSPPLYVQSVFGPAYTWAYARRKYSEFNILNPWKPIRTLTYLRDITVPSIPGEPCDIARTLLPPLIQDTFWRETRYFQQSDPFDSVNSFPDERWFYINGIGTNGVVARMNSQYLAELFHRPMTVIQNSTNSLAIDLTACVVGKGLKTNPNINNEYSMTEPAVKATSAILDALNAPQTKKVVVIAHSEGTIILSNVLQAIAKVIDDAKTRAVLASTILDVKDLVERLMVTTKSVVSESLKNILSRSIVEFCREGLSGSFTHKLAKLEVYPFANCANKMTYIDAANQYPYIENFANERDIVARLGVLSPENKPGGLVQIDGAVYENTTPWKRKHSCWGHLLNQHYLFAIDDYLSAKVRGEKGELTDPYPLQKASQLQPEPNKPLAREPRLYSYFHGGSPTSWLWRDDVQQELLPAEVVSIA
jgi:hypothetical protein